MKKDRSEREPKFYEMDGALRAYSNRTLVIAGLMGVTALVAVTGFLFVRMQPPTVIKVNSAGEAQVRQPLWDQFTSRRFTGSARVRAQCRAGRI